jgi:hypothetical protein
VEQFESKSVVDVLLTSVHFFIEVIPVVTFLVGPFRKRWACCTDIIRGVAHIRQVDIIKYLRYLEFLFLLLFYVVAKGSDGRLLQFCKFKLVMVLYVALILDCFLGCVKVLQI